MTLTPADRPREVLRNLLASPSTVRKRTSALTGRWSLSFDPCDAQARTQPLGYSRPYDRSGSLYVFRIPAAISDRSRSASDRVRSRTVIEEDGNVAFERPILAAQHARALIDTGLGRSRFGQRLGRADKILRHHPDDASTRAVDVRNEHERQRDHHGHDQQEALPRGRAA